MKHERTNKNSNTSFYKCSKKSTCSYRWKVVVEREKCIIHEANEHEEHVENCAVTKAMKDIIRERISRNDKVSSIDLQKIFQANGWELPESTQLSNAVQRLKRKLNVNEALSFADVMDSVNEFPNEEDKACIMDFKYDLEDKNFVIIISTKKLIEKQSDQSHAQIDATFKANLGEYPVSMVGFSDEDRHFHPTLAAIISNENTKCYTWILEFMKNNQIRNNYIPKEIMADCHQAISAAINKVFPNTLRRCCYFHVKKSIEKRMTDKDMNLDANMKSIIMEDFKFLSKCSSKHEYEVVVKALVADWNLEEMKPFAKYFDDQWKDKPTWIALRGAGPRTNNALEATNNVLKQKFIVSKVSVKKCIQDLCVFLNFVEGKKYPKIQGITEADFKAAYKFKKIIPQRSVETVIEGICYIVESSKSILDQSDKSRLLRKWMNKSYNYSDLQDFHQNFYIVQKSTLFPVFTCTCPIGILREHCKHSTLIGALTKLTPWPRNIRELTTEFRTTAPKKGRTKKRTKALVKD
uniref:MULE transposase domain-containing protein n=1 Tax=Panagrolaimus sp. JU765 TaxID=591449 RepID=A0AC34RGL6_9BILA